MNNSIFYFFFNLSHQSTELNKFIYFVAQVFPYLVLLGAFIFLVWHQDALSSFSSKKESFKKWSEVFFVFFASGLAWVVAHLLKNLFQTPRPFIALANTQSVFLETGYAFPSGHATFFTALAVSIFLIHKKVGYLFLFFALLIGLARIVAGVHFPVDILGGFILGVLIAYLARGVFNHFAHPEAEIK